MNDDTINSARSLSLLADFCEEMETISDPLILFERACRFLPQLTETTFASLLLFELPSGQLIYKNISTLDSPVTHWPCLVCRQIDEAVLQQGTVLTCDPQQADRFLILLDEEDGPWQQCELHLPLFWDGNHFALLSVGQKKNGAEFSVVDLQLLRILGCLLSRWAVSLSGVEKNQATSPVGRRPLRCVDPYADIIGVSPAIQEIKKIIAQIAPTEAGVLITGESGTGKELVARAIHRSSRRSDHSMVVMNCASIPETLVESELFGHEKGAFTGAICRRKGKFELAHTSTLFLDEIGDMSLSAQAKLLRVLQDGIFQRVGGEGSVQADVRLISATNKNIHELIRQGGFREDLFFRINLVQIELLPLRDHLEDVPLLVEFFLSQFNEKYHAGLSRINQELYRFLLNYDYPGNVRELRNMVERAVIFHNNPEAIRRMIHSSDPAQQSQRLAEMERQHILAVLQQTDHNKSEAARRLGIARKTLRKKLGPSSS